MKEGSLFTVEDHMRVQQQIEARANELWREGGCADGEALRDWLRAEREVLEQFVLAYDLAQPAGQEPDRKPTVEVRARRPNGAILRQRRNNKSQKLLGTTISL